MSTPNKNELKSGFWVLCGQKTKTITHTPRVRWKEKTATRCRHGMGLSKIPALHSQETGNSFLRFNIKINYQQWENFTVIKRRVTFDLDSFAPSPANSGNWETIGNV